METTIKQVGAGWSGISTAQDARGWHWRRGTVATPNGYVVVYASSEHRVSDLTVIFNGQLYRRQYTDFYSERYLATLAKRFAKEMASRP